MKFHTFSHNFLNVMEKAMKFHTRCHHIRHNGIKQVKKARIWVPWECHLLYSSFCLLVIKNMSTYVVNMSQEKILHVKNYCIFKTYRIIMFFLLVKCCDINFHTCKNPLQYQTRATLMRICLSNWKWVRLLYNSINGRCLLVAQQIRFEILEGVWSRARFEGTG